MRSGSTRRAVSDGPVSDASRASVDQKRKISEVAEMPLPLSSVWVQDRPIEP
jgi:hypothetical protein